MDAMRYAAVASLALLAACDSFGTEPSTTASDAASPPPPADASPDGGSVGDAGGAADLCAIRGPGVVCTTFEDGTFPPSGWTPIVSAGGLLDLSSARSVSPQHSMRADFASSSNAGNRAIRLHVAVPNATRTIHLTFAFAKGSLHASTTARASIAELLLTSASVADYGWFLRVDDTNQLVVETGLVGTATPVGPISTTDFTRVEILATMPGATTGSAVVTVSADGHTSVATIPVPSAPKPDTIDLNVGLGSNPGGAAAGGDAFYDDVAYALGN